MFGFGGRRHDKLHYFRDGKNQTIMLWEGGLFSETKMWALALLLLFDSL
jgi:hypothetical protein